MRYKKIIAFFLLTLVFAGMLFGCGKDTSQLPTVPPEENYQEYEEPAFEAFELEKVGYSGSFAYYRDIVTDVLYLQYRGTAMNAGMGGLTVMLDPETGLPMTYTRYMELYNEIS